MTKSIKQDYISYRLKSSKETLEAARLPAKNEHWNSAINRLYYSCFYAISALLYKYDINANSHAGLKHQFTLHFIKTEVIDKELGRVFVELFDWDILILVDSKQVTKYNLSNCSLFTIKKGAANQSSPYTQLTKP